MAVPLPGLNFTSTRQSTSVAQSTSIAFNPVIATTFGSGDASGSPSGSATGTPYAPSNASGSDAVGFPSTTGGLGGLLGGGYTPQLTATSPSPTLASQNAQAGQNGSLLPILLGGGALLFLLANQ